MSHEFKGSIQNALRPEGGVNMVVKGLNDKIILAPSGFSHEFEKKVDDKKLSFSITPSSGTTEGREIQAEMKNGKEKISDSSTHWEVEITSTSDSNPAEALVAVVPKME